MSKTVTAIIIILLFIVPTYLLIEKDKTNKDTEVSELTFAVHPFLEEETLINKFTPITKYISQKLNKPVKLMISSSYEEHLKKIGTDEYDFAYIGSALYVELVDKYGRKPLLASMAINGIPFFQSVIIAKEGSSVTTIKELSGKSFAFAKPLSTSGSILPKGMLVKAGINIDNLSYIHLENHEEVAKAVLEGKYDAGAVKQEVFEQNRGKGIKELARSTPVAEYVFVGSKTADPELLKTIKEILINAGYSKEGKDVLKNIKSTCTQLSHADDLSFNSLREYMGYESEYKWDYKK